MKYVLSMIRGWRRFLFLALPLACCLVLLLPATSEAHAILLQQDTLSSASAGGSNGQLDGPAFLSFLMITLVDLGSIFWVGAQLWRMFVPPAEEDESDEQKELRRQEERRFDRLFALPSLLLILLANVGVLIGQDLLVSNSSFGMYWTLREVIVLLALLLAVYVFITRTKQRPRIVDASIGWINLVLGLALLIALTLSGDATATSSNILVFSVLVDWLHLLAASLWIGGMMYIATTYLPVLKGRSLQERVSSLLSTLPRYAPLAITGVIIMAVSGPFNATVHMDSWAQLFSTAYGRALVIKVLLVCALLVTNTIHMRIFRPRLAKDYMKYNALSLDKEVEAAEKAEGDTEEETGKEEASTTSSEEYKQLEGEVARQTTRLTKTLHWEPLLGVGILICTGLLNVFAGTLTAAAPAQSVPTQQQQQQQQTVSNKPFTATVTTSDHLYTAQLEVSPNRFGPNTFTVHVLDKNGKPDTNVSVSLYTTMLDMDMGTTQLNLQPDNKGGFSADGDLDMSGNWQIRVVIRTPDSRLHEGTVKMITLD